MLCGLRHIPFFYLQFWILSVTRDNVNFVNSGVSVYWRGNGQRSIQMIFQMRQSIIHHANGRHTWHPYMESTLKHTLKYTAAGAKPLLRKKSPAFPSHFSAKFIVTYYIIYKMNIFSLSHFILLPSIYWSSSGTGCRHCNILHSGRSYAFGSSLNINSQSVGIVKCSAILIAVTCRCNSECL